MADAYGPAVGVHAVIVAGNIEELQAPQYLRGERLIDFDNVDIGEIQLRSTKRLAHRKNRTDTHDTRFHSRGARHHESGHRRDAGSGAYPLASNQERHRSVIDTRRAARSHDAAVE